MISAGVKIHPFDVRELNKGDWIPPDRCEEATGYSRNHPRYSIKLMSLAKETERLWLREKDEDVTVRAQRNGLLICSDDDAVGVNKKRRQHGVRKIKRAFAKQGAIDRSKITSQALLDENERELRVGGAMIAGINKAVHVSLKPYVRQTPGLPPKKK